MTNMAVPFYAVFHALIAAIALGKVWDEFKLIRRCIRAKDEKAYRECLKDRIPMMIHMLLAVMSVILIGGLFAIKYHNPIAGLYVITTVALILSLYWEVATTLDDPTKAPWFYGQIPHKWTQPEPPHAS